jgi:hypothetical protein
VVIACVNKKVIRSTLPGEEIRLDVELAKIATGYRVD